MDNEENTQENAQENTPESERVDEIFQDIQRNTSKSVAEEMGTRRFKITDQPEPKRAEPIRQEEPEQPLDSYDEYEEEQPRISIKTILIVIFLIVATVFITAFVCRFTEDMNYATARNQNSDYQKQIEQLNKELEAKDQEIIQAELGAMDDSDVMEDLSEEMNKLNSKITELEDSLKTKNDEIEDLKLQLKEAQFRADMFQKYGPYWEE